jgi:signal transduction histidine kinase
VTRANRLVLDLLDAARIQSGRAIVVEPALIEVRPLLEEVVDAYRLQCEQKQQELTCHVERDATHVYADHDRLLQALSNLVGNAVKFTPEGGHIRVHARPDGVAGVEFAVSDTGPGIDADVLPHLFDAFTQAKETASLGTGLGLSIVRGIVEAHGGRVTVDTVPGSGTTFRFVLPPEPLSVAEDRRRQGDRREGPDD